MEARGGGGGGGGGGSKVIIVYPTVEPAVVVVPILTSISVFPVLVFLTICCLRKMAARRRALGRLANRSQRSEERICFYRSPPLSSGLETTTTLELMTPGEEELLPPPQSPTPAEEDIEDL